MASAAKRIAAIFRDSLRTTQETSVVVWAERNVKLIGSARSVEFNSSITPWTRAPLECGADGVTRTCTFVKPVQSGGSVVGEVLLCYWIATSSGGDIAYYWPKDEKAQDRWKKRISRIIGSCAPIAARLPAEGLKISKEGLVLFNHLNLAVIGAFTQGNVESDSYRRVICEEVHDNENNRGWQPGRLQQAHNRATAFWNSQIFNISNAGTKGDQLDQAFETGTKQYWEVRCPGCGRYHAMRTRYDDKQPELGGLRYNAEGCRRKNGHYDYNRLESSIRYEFPCCRREVRDDPTARRALSLSGCYGDPTNPGAHISNRSFTFEAVSVDYIPWLKLIQEKHSALRALRYGDPLPWKRYRQERECLFYDPQDRPLTGQVEVTVGLKKNREGLRGHPDFCARYFALDRQQGEMKKGELPHWWLVIRDVLTTGDSQLVFEGKIETDENVIQVLDDHGCIRRHGAADSGDDTTHVYQFCLRYGISAIKGGTDSLYSHGEDGLKIFSPEQPLCQMLNTDPTCEDEKDEPQFWRYSKHGIRDRLAYLKAGKAVRHDIPEDVSEDYRKHNEAESAEIKHDKDGHPYTVYVQHADRNDLYVCECYIAMLMEMAGLIGALAYVPGKDDAESNKSE